MDYLKNKLVATENITTRLLTRSGARSQRDKESAKEASKDLTDILHNAERDWKNRGDQVIGHVVLSPPISVEDDGFTEDWAVTEVDTTKIDKSTFIGNVIDLGEEISIPDLTRWMSLNWSRSNWSSNLPSFQYPGNRLLRFLGTISDEDPDIVDHNGDAVTMVLKRGCTSGLTVGRLNRIRSFTRQ